MDTIFTEVCALVTAAFVLTLVPGFRRSERSLLVGEGAAVTLRIPLRFEVANASLEEVGADTGQLAPN